MSIGTGIVLFVIGAVLAFAVNGDLGGGFVDLNMIGYILMGGGFIVFLIGMIFIFKKRQSVTTARTVADHVSGERVVQQETLHSGTPLV